MAERPEFTHKRERHGLIGPFSGRQLAAVFAIVVVAVVVLVAATTPLGTAGAGPGPIDPRATAYIIDDAPAVGLRPGDRAPEFAVTLEDGSTYQLTDLDGNPIRLADLRGKAVWVNFWATWCPPCQAETPILREMSERIATGASRSSRSASRRRPRPMSRRTPTATSWATRSASMVRADLPPVPGLRPADPVLHRRERRHPRRRARPADPEAGAVPTSSGSCRPRLDRPAPARARAPRSIAASRLERTSPSGSWFVRDGQSVRQEPRRGHHEQQPGWDPEDDQQVQPPSSSRPGSDHRQPLRPT